MRFLMTLKLKAYFRSLCVSALLFGFSLPILAASVSKPVYYQLKKVDELLAKKSYTKAEKTLKKRLKFRNSGYEKAVLLRSLSSVYAAQKNYVDAIVQLNKSLNLKTLPYSAAQKAHLTLGQYYLANQQQDKALVILEKWLKKNPNPKPKTAMLLANLFSQNKQYSKALPLVKKAIAATAKPPKAWMELQLALSYKTKDYSTAIAALEKLLKQQPDNKQHWQQLSTAYFNAKDYTQAASIQYLAYQRGFLESENEKVELIKLFLQAGIPQKAAQILEQEFKQKTLSENVENLELLADAWLQAKEDQQAQQVLESALKIKPNASLYEKLAQIYSRQKLWQQSQTAFMQALELGEFQQQGNSQLLLGMSYYHLQKLEQAEHAFEMAILDPATAKSAQQWLSYLKKQPQVQ